MFYLYDREAVHWITKLRQEKSYMFGWSKYQYISDEFEELIDYHKSEIPNSKDIFSEEESDKEKKYVNLSERKLYYQQQSK